VFFVVRPAIVCWRQGRGIHIRLFTPFARSLRDLGVGMRLLLLSVCSIIPAAANLVLDAFATK